MDYLEPHLFILKVKTKVREELSSVWHGLKEKIAYLEVKKTRQCQSKVEFLPKDDFVTGVTLPLITHLTFPPLDNSQTVSVKPAEA